MTTLKDLECIKPLFRIEIQYYYDLITRVMSYDEIMTIFPNVKYTILSRYITIQISYMNFLS